ncbi:hypothetical protein F5Y05DRAFT_412569 [Hypoxylon sp. FL0543]|nr:hypothetical protein F5Y05DRAFT_412569 [Hypoxylon sp. FL0543]
MPFAGNGAVLDNLSAHVREPGQAPRALRAFDEVRRPQSQAVVDLARKFGRLYAYARDGMHKNPAKMKEFFAEMAAFTNDFDVKGQNEAAIWSFLGVSDN